MTFIGSAMCTNLNKIFFQDYRRPQRRFSSEPGIYLCVTSRDTFCADKSQVDYAGPGTRGREVDSLYTLRCSCRPFPGCCGFLRHPRANARPTRRDRCFRFTPSLYLINSLAQRALSAESRNPWTKTTFEIRMGSAKVVKLAEYPEPLGPPSSVSFYR